LSRSVLSTSNKKTAVPAKRRIGLERNNHGDPDQIAPSRLSKVAVAEVDGLPLVRRV